METIEEIRDGLDGIPAREIYYYGPKLKSCSLKRSVKIDKYIFELYTYDINGNGKIFVKMFDSESKPILEKLTISLEYFWAQGLTVEFYNDFSSSSQCYFQYKVLTELGLESVLKKLVLVAEKKERYKEKYPSFQYDYAYLVFLFYKKIEDKIRVTEISYISNILKKVKALITSELTDNVNHYQFSTNTIYYKALERFYEGQKKKILNTPIWYDL